MATVKWKRKKSHGTFKIKYGDNIKIDLKEIELGSAKEFICLSGEIL
jgi:hypothetical protein